MKFTQIKCILTSLLSQEYSYQTGRTVSDSLSDSCYDTSPTTSSILERVSVPGERNFLGNLYLNVYAGRALPNAEIHVLGEVAVGTKGRKIASGRLWTVCTGPLTAINVQDGERECSPICPPSPSLRTGRRGVEGNYSPESTTSKNSSIHSRS